MVLQNNSKPKALYINIRAKGEAPTFECKALEQSSGKLSGNLTSIWVREPNEYVDFATVNMEFYNDKGERYIVSGGFSNLMTSIINSFAQGVDDKIDFKKITLSLYSRDGYARVGVFGNNGMIVWKHDIKELNAMTKRVRVNGKDVTDREELNNFLRKEIETINTYLSTLDNTTSLEEDADFNPTEDMVEDVEVEVEKEAEVSDLPF